MDSPHRRLNRTAASGLELRALTKRYDHRITVVERVGLTVPHGTFVCLLGPSGCGKTTLLRMIAGLEQPSEGAILLDGEDIAGVPTHRRDFGMVFQSLALFPHLTVGENIAYPLKLRGQGREERRQRADELLRLVQLPGLADRAIGQLSGGQRQRVAIARALALQPRLFLLDEPLSALDAKLREAMQLELRQLQQQLGITTIVVTHDQREAMTMADLVVVMGEGRVRQAAAPVEIYRRPADAFVADFIGSTNLVPIESDGNGGALAFGHPVEGLKLPPGHRAATLSIRPEDVELTPDVSGRLAGRVGFVRDLGATVETFVDLGDRRIVAVSPPRTRPPFKPGDTVGVSLPADHCVVLTS